MTSLKTSLVSASLVAGAIALTAQTADAQVLFLSRSGQDSLFAAGVHGYGEHEIPSSENGLRNPRVLPASRRLLYSVDRGLIWRETSSLELRPAEVMRHGEHYDVLPGHYVYRREGHWE